MFWEKKTKIRKHIIFYGRVQGVGFRYYAVPVSYTHLTLPTNREV